MDGEELRERERSGPEPGDRPEQTFISVRTLMLSIGALVSAAIIAFTGVFFYEYLKPKYGGLVIKTTPPGAVVYVDGEQRGSTPITLTNLRSGLYQVKAAKEGYNDMVQQVEVMPYATENLHWKLDPLVPHLSNEQLAEVESWRKMLDNARRDGILFPPPEDYNVLYFANRMLAIDPANAYATAVKGELAETIRHNADLAYAREDWLEAEKQYQYLGMIFPEDISVNERLGDIAAKIDASVKDREKQIEDWRIKAEAAMKAGSLVPPERDNALDSLNSILRLDKKNIYARSTLGQLKEMLQTRGDKKIAGEDWQGARTEFRTVLQYFPEDSYSRTRLAMVESRLSEMAQADQQRLQSIQEEQTFKQTVVSLRQSALAAFRSGSYAKSIEEWEEYLKFDPSSDESYYYIGASYQEERQFDTAILNFEKCISINQNNALAHLNLGILYDRHRHDLKRASEHLRKVKELGGVDKYTADRLQAMIQDLQDRQQLATLQKTPFPVEHKHAFSSCRGVLRITGEGVEYHTMQTDHSFYETYSGLRNFSVDQSEISIRTRNNKKYNFNLLSFSDAARVRLLASQHIQLTD